MQQLEAIRAEIEHMRRQIHRQRKEIQTLQRAGIGAASTDELLTRMLARSMSFVHNAIGWWGNVASPDAHRA